MIDWVETRLLCESELPLTQLEKEVIEKNWELSDEWDSLFMKNQKYFFELLYVDNYFDRDQNEK